MADVIIGFVHMDEPTEKAVRAAQLLGHRVYVESKQINYQTAVSVHATRSRYAPRPCPACGEEIPGNVTVCTRCDTEDIPLGEEVP